jgi:dienelactone hydrolase
MKHRIKWVVVLVMGLSGSARGAAEDGTRILESGQLPRDSRLDKAKDLNGYFPMTPVADRDAWQARRQALREQLLVATGLWPMPQRGPVDAVIHGKIERNEYTIEKVFFASYPGHYVSGNLYRPKGKTGKLPAVLSPHGHWRHGRFTDELTDRGKQGESYIQDQIKQGAEQTAEGARYPLQARCAQLARMGCIVFHYDMVGYADSTQIGHRAGFTDAAAELRLQSFMGLQTFNSIRALDFLVSLPDVDPRRVGVTGASGGGTQTFILCGIDDRPVAAFPAVMVSTAMQGGCICENCSYLRQNTGNVELAALFAPKPLGMTGAKDWTIDIETKGLPELKALYRLYGAEDRVMAKCFPQFGHNYNQVSREVMYNWFNKHLQLGLPEPVLERPFTPVPPKELSVYDEGHPRPQDASDAAKLRQVMTASSDKQMAALRPRDVPTLKEFRRVVGTALRVMIQDQLPAGSDIESSAAGEHDQEGFKIARLFLGRRGQGEQIPTLLVTSSKPSERVVVWIHPDGKSSLLHGGKLNAAVRQLLDRNVAIVAPDVFLTGEFSGAKAPAVNPQYAGFTFGYNRPLLANRVHDILTAVAFARTKLNGQRVELVGFDNAGPWVLLARGLCGDAVERTAADMHHFDFDQVDSIGHPMMLPGALKYGGSGALAGLCFPGELYLYNDDGGRVAKSAKEAYLAGEQPSRLRLERDKVSAEKVVQWLVP